MKPKPVQPNFRLLTPYEIDKLAEAIVKKLGKRDRILTVKQVAGLLGISETAVRMRCQRGQMPFHRRNGGLYFSENELNEYYLRGDEPADDTDNRREALLGAKPA